jgi:anti-sigma B factor antagonist
LPCHDFIEIERLPLFQICKIGLSIRKGDATEGVVSMGIRSFQIIQQETEQAYIFRLSGDLDLSAATQFRSELQPIVHKADKMLVFDFEHLTYIDSTGIGMIVSVLKIREQLKAKFVVWNIPDAIRRLLDITGISKYLSEGLEEGI